MEFFKGVSVEVVYVAVAAAGGGARYLQKYLEEGKFGWSHLLVHLIVSAFSGYMFYQCAVNVLNVPETVVPVLAGMGGWMGVESLKVVETLTKKLFREDKKDE